jgi:hypothetical protein
MDLAFVQQGLDLLDRMRPQHLALPGQEVFFINIHHEGSEKFS